MSSTTAISNGLKNVSQTNFLTQDTLSWCNTDILSLSIRHPRPVPPSDSSENTSRTATLQTKAGSRRIRRQFSNHSSCASILRGRDSPGARLKIRSQRNPRTRIQTPNSGLSLGKGEFVASLQAREKLRRFIPKPGGRFTSFSSRALSFRTTFPRGHSGSKLLPVGKLAD